MVLNTTNGQEGLDKIVEDPEFDLVLMDIQLVHFICQNSHLAHTMYHHIRMPILDGFQATQKIREHENSTPGLLSLDAQRISRQQNGRIPIFAVSASLMENQREQLSNYGFDGWILKPIDFTRLNVLLKGITDPAQRRRDVYRPGRNWESGGWLKSRKASS